MERQTFLKNMNKRWIVLASVCIVVVLIITVLLFAIGKLPFGSEKSREAYSSPNDIVLSKDGKYAYISDETLQTVYKYSLSQNKKVDQFTTDSQVNGVCLYEETICVLEGSLDGKVTLLDNNMKALKTIETGHTPTDMVYKDNIGYVINRFSRNVSVIDLKEGKKITDIDIPGREPVCCLLAGNKLFVGCHLPDEPSTEKVISSNVCVIDTSLNEVIDTISLVNGSGSLRGMCLSPDGTTIYASHIIARYTYPTSQLDRGWINTNGISIIDVSLKEPVTTVLLDDVEKGAANPWGISVNSDGSRLFVALSGTQELMTVDLNGLKERIANVKNGSGLVEKTEDIVDYIPFLNGLRNRYELGGNGARALALSDDKAFVCQYFTGDVAVYDMNSCKIETISLTKQPKADEIRYGQTLWYDANYCYQQWESCASCHPDARADGFNWDNLNDGLGNPKSAKSMLYSHRTPPVMATGIRKSAEIAVRAGMKFIQFNTLNDEGMSAIDSYLKSIQPEASPYLKRDGTLTEAAVLGKELFKSAGCVSCHPAPYYTNSELYDIGTKTADNWEDTKYKVPTLLEVWRTAPYLHDGSLNTVEEVVKKSAPELTDAEIKDLSAYVLSIGAEGENYGSEQVIASSDNETKTYINKLVPDSTILSISVRQQIENAPDAKMIMSLCGADGSEVKSFNYKLSGISYNQDYKIELKNPFKVPEDLAEGSYLRISFVSLKDNEKLATDLVIRN